MKLNPKGPPGRTNRKARAFTVEIARLRAEGYTCDAIREALADAGVIVSTSTVQREAIRPSTRAAHSTAYTSALEAHAPHQLLAEGVRSGKDIAEGFVRSRITNPLIRARSRDEDSGH